jgi:putative sigma-54 modulation protein
MDEMHAAIDKIVDKLERRLTRYRDKIKKYREGKPKAASSVSGDAVSKIIVTRTVDAKPMDPEEATMQLDASGDNFMIFRDRINGNICVIYKRRDGDFSLIETLGKSL